MTEQEQMFLYALLSRVPGKTAQQKLNYIQDWAKGVNLDLFGTAQQYTPAPPPVTYNKTAEMYGGKGNDALDSIFNSIESGVDPFTAVEQARGDKGLPNEYKKINNENGIDYTAIAQQYAADKVASDRQLAEYQIAESQRAAEYEASKPAQLGDVLRTKYDVMSEAYGKPLTGEELLNKYAGSKRTTVLRGPHAQQTLFSANPEEDKILREFALRTLDKRLASSKQQLMPTERGQAALSALPFFNFGE